MTNETLILTEIKNIIFDLLPTLGLVYEKSVMRYNDFISYLALP